MCGRAAQTSEAVSFAAESLQKISKVRLQASYNASESNKNYEESESAAKDHDTSDAFRNYNMSPGMDALVFWKDSETNEIRMGRKVWGLVSRGGNSMSPIPEGMNKHFEGLMFNARSDTLYQKPTFAKLANSGKTCLVALDGFFEWKSELKGKKQPYFVYRKNKPEIVDSEGNPRLPYLLMPGLWTSVQTGREADPVLDTFTLITTEVCKPLSWLHTRMPVVVWDERLALQWLERPSPTVLKNLEDAAHQTPENVFEWHAVTSEMSSMKFRSDEAIKPLPKMKTVKSFFTATSSAEKSSGPVATSLKKTSTATPQKRSADTTITSPSQKSHPLSSKKPKAGTMQSFFKPKNSPG